MDEEFGSSFNAFDALRSCKRAKKSIEVVTESLIVPLVQPVAFEE